MRAAILIVLLLLSGCSGSTDTVPAGRETTTPPSGLCIDATDTPTNGTCGGVDRLPAVTFAMDWDGNLGIDAFVCQNAVGCYPDEAIVAGTSERLVDAAGWNLTAANLTVTWTAQSPATAEMGIAVMTMHCEICNMSDEGVKGASPLVLHLDGLHAAVGAGGVVHVYLYHTTSASPGGGAFVYGGPDQAFHVSGQLTFEGKAGTPPPAARS
ncbi:MAG: hypothetical protein V4510_05805 [bacterium]